MVQYNGVESSYIKTAPMVTGRLGVIKLEEQIHMQPGNLTGLGEIQFL